MSRDMAFPDFSPATALLGGLFIGSGASLLWLINGRIAGISGILAGLVEPKRGDLAWRALFLSGLLLAGLVAQHVHPQSMGVSPRGLAGLGVAGVLVGVGTKMGRGCTSGHGVCGISRLSVPSIVATLTFIVTGVVTVTLLRVVGGAR